MTFLRKWRSEVLGKRVNSNRLIVASLLGGGQRPRLQQTPKAELYAIDSESFAS